MTERVTLKQVAIQAGVSYQTVSKVLNQQTRVSKETEERIMQAVTRLGYRPNQIARSLRAQRTHLIGYSWEPAPAGQTNPILDQFLQSMAEAAQTAGYHIICFPNQTGKDALKGYQELIATNRVDGFIISSVDFNDPRIYFLQQANFPFVAFGRSNPELNIPFVDVDGARGMHQVVQHLVDNGHVKIAALGWPKESRVGQNRMSGFLEAIHAAGLNLRPEWLIRGEGRYQFSLEAAERLLVASEDQRPTAIVAFNDIMAIGAMQAAKNLGFQVGVDLAITGFDDTPMIQYLTPALTSVRQPIWEVGQQVIGILLDVLQDGALKESSVLLAPRLIVRASSDLSIGKTTWAPSHFVERR